MTGTAAPANPPAGDPTPRSPAALARLLGVDRTTITRALNTAAAAGRELPEHTTDEHTGRRLFTTGPFLTWWANRPPRGRPAQNARGNT